MAEPFKELVNTTSVASLAREIAAVSPAFQAKAFQREALAGLKKLELKDRVRQVARVLRSHLPADWPDALSLLLQAMEPPLADGAPVTSGARYWPVLQVVEDHGTQSPRQSLAALQHMTQRFSAEFAIRPLLAQDPEGVLAELARWTDHESQHVRRLVSEGTRPRLPWGMRLQAFIDQPESTLPLLERLKDDPEQYVRRSVANHLNDIAKDHPDLVTTLARRWWSKDDANRQRLVRHALRTLVKAGNPKALAVLGFHKPRLQVSGLRLGSSHVQYGDALEFSIDLRSTHSRSQRLMVDYALVLPRKGGKTSRKVFKGSQRTLAAGATWPFEKRHPFKKVTTRKHYQGTHQLEIQVNGRTVAQTGFELLGGDA